jgi:2-polyprenyl-3-methyl-5-hydroxy-6-metoxy-1,4-benzoquinol methylase
MDIRFLDFGMGWGERALSAKAFGYDSYGVEISQKEVEFASSRGIKAFLDSEHIDQKFDFINSYGVIDQVLEPVKTVKKLCAMLDDNGIIKISTQNSQWFPEKIMKGRWDRSMREMLPLLNPNGFTYATLIRLGKLCGLKKIKARRIFKALIPALYQGSTNLKFMARNLLKHSFGTRTGLEIFFEKQ